MIVIRYKTRKPIIQAQIDDFIGKKIVKIYRMWVPREYRHVRKHFRMLIKVRQYRRRCTLAAGKQVPGNKTLDGIIRRSKVPSLPKPRYLFRFRSIPRYLKEDHAGDLISDREWMLVHALHSFTGYFNNMLELNDLSILDEIQEKLEDRGISFKKISIRDVFAFELLRLQLGFKDYTGLEKVGRFVSRNPLWAILRDPGFFPRARDVSRVMCKIPPCMLERLFHCLVDEAIELKLIVPRVLVWDTQFIRSNCSNNKRRGARNYTDPDAGYGRHRGKKLGVGYKISSLYAYCGSWKRTFPVHFDVFPANKNDGPIFRQSLSNFLSRRVGKWKIVLADSGAYSLSNLEFCMSRGIYPLIKARKNLVRHPVVEVRKGFWFNRDFFPPGWSVDDVRDAYSRRPVIEACQASNVTFYNSRRMNGRGLDNVRRGRAMIYILDMLRALTAVKIGRPDLVSKLTAFSTGRAYLFGDAWVYHALRSDQALLEVGQDEGNRGWTGITKQEKYSLF